MGCKISTVTYCQRLSNVQYTLSKISVLIFHGDREILIFTGRASLYIHIYL